MRGYYRLWKEWTLEHGFHITTEMGTLVRFRSLLLGGEWALDNTVRYVANLYT